MIIHTLRGNSQLSEEKWYVLYTAPRAEKVVYKYLLERQYKAFLPISKTLSIWKNRQKKIIEKPLFSSYVFAKTYEQELFNIIAIPRVLTYLRIGSKPSTLSDEEIKQIQTLTSEGSKLILEPELVTGETVRINDGPFMGFIGILQHKNGKNRFGIQLKGLNHTVFVELQTSNLERLN